MNVPPHVANRRSVFPQFFTDRAVSRATIDTLLEAANLAPSHRKTEPWRYRVYTGKGKQTLLREMQTTYENLNGTETWTEKLANKFGKKLEQSPVVLVIFLSRDPAASVPEWEEVAAVGASVTNLWNSLADFNLGGYWSSPGFLCGDYGAYPGTPANHRCLGMFYLGYHEAPELPRPRGGWAEKVTYVG
ncbi:nitroreductase family protein [Neolewinella antarctica]|uniref:Nitroreductase n=1 Tax=Neolewinella antarctica TaxID=442734 RepID=A0ABX0XB78_9BACT|nr:nitroreductase [Neolewinella antarctica]NJC26505.1 nitroreductase [Neolewinella antarctica]